MSTSDYKRQYAAAVEPLFVNPDYHSAGIAPRLGNALLKLATDPETPHEVHSLAKSILSSGEHTHLPMLQDALMDAGHPAAEWFDWQHAPRGIAIDKALHQAIASHRRVAGAGGGARHIVLSPGWVLSDWKERVKRNLQMPKALAAIHASVPDANIHDLAHSALRLYAIQYGLMPQVVQGTQWREAHLQDHLREIAKLPHEIRPDWLHNDAANVEMVVRPRRVSWEDSEKIRRQAETGQLTHPNVHRYPDTRR